MEQVDPALDERGEEIVLGAGLCLADVCFGLGAGRPERRIHEDDIEAISAEVDKGEPLDGVLGEESPPEILGPFYPARVGLQALQNAVLRLAPEGIPRDAREIEPHRALLRPRLLGEQLRLLRFRACLTLIPGLLDGTLDLLFDFQQRASFPGQAHLIENDLHQLSENCRLQTRREIP